MGYFARLLFTKQGKIWYNFKVKMDNTLLEKALSDRENENNLRTLSTIDVRKTTKVTIDGIEYIDFASNDYLSLSQNKHVIAAAIAALNEFGASSSASRLMSGTNALHQKLEEKTAAYKGYETVLLFNSGFQANVGILPAIVSRHDLIVADELIHASLIDGAILSRAKFIRYRHNDLCHLEELLKRNRDKYPNILIVTESLFSMDGDIAPMCEIVKLKNRYNAELFVDEAHATGVFGAGIVSMLSLQSEVKYLLGTFSKGFGSFGAFLACDKMTRNYLINFCRSFIYSTSLPPAVVASSIAAVDYCEKNSFIGEDTLKKAEYFRAILKEIGLNVLGESQIVPVIVGDSELALKAQAELKARGYNSLAVRPPTVKDRSARLRFSICFDHIYDDFDAVAGILKGIF